jgi:hypothetical protein
MGQISHLLFIFMLDTPLPYLTALDYSTQHWIVQHSTVLFSIVQCGINVYSIGDHLA